MQVAPSSGKKFNQSKLRHLVLTEINLEWFWLNKISQVMDSIPWVRCAYGNVLVRRLPRPLLWACGACASHKRRDFCFQLIEPQIWVKVQVEQWESGWLLFAKMENSFLLRDMKTLSQPSVVLIIIIYFGPWSKERNDKKCLEMRENNKIHFAHF